MASLSGNPESEALAQSHSNVFQKHHNFKMLITFEQKVPQKSDKSDLRRLERLPLKKTFKNPTFQL